MMQKEITTNQMIDWEKDCSIPTNIQRLPARRRCNTGKMDLPEK
jgi:hypothetical protein